MHNLYTTSASPMHPIHAPPVIERVKQARIIPVTCMAARGPLDRQRPASRAASTRALDPLSCLAPLSHLFLARHMAD